MPRGFDAYLYATTRPVADDGDADIFSNRDGNNGYVEINMANLGTIGSTTRKQINSAYLLPVTGLEKITGVVKQNGVDIVGTVTLIEMKH